MSFMMVMRVVADLPAASCNAIELLVLLLCLDDGVGLPSMTNGDGLLLALVEP